MSPLMMNRNLLVWLSLMAFTVLSFYLAESSRIAWALAAIMVVTVIKGHFVVTEFMELRGVRHPLGVAMALYSPLLGIIIFFILRPSG